MVVGRSSFEWDPMKFEVGLPLQTRRIIRGGIAAFGVGFLEDVKDIFISLLGGPLREQVGGICDERESVEDASQRLW